MGRLSSVVFVLLLFVVVSVSNAETVRVFYKPDKSVVIIHPAPKSKVPTETEEQWLERVFNQATESNGLGGLPYEDIDSSLLPAERSERSAWEGSIGQPISVNQDKANAASNNTENNKKIKAAARQIAIDSLKESGGLPADYVE